MTHAPPAERIRKRVPCDVRFRESHRSGMVLNLSKSGLFVQTTLGAKPGEPVELFLNAPNSPVAIPVRAEVVWNRVVNPTFRSVVQGGFGARISAASDDYYELIGASAGPVRPDRVIAARTSSAAPSARELETPAESYRVRVKLEGKPRSRFVTVSAASAQDAEKRALERLGKGWTILSGAVLDPPSDT